MARDEASQGSLVYAFPDGSGLIRGVFRVVEGEASDVLWRVEAKTLLDVQALPSWEMEREHPETLEVLREEDVFAELGRLVSFKGAWRSLAKDALEEGACAEFLGSGVWALAALDEDERGQYLLDISASDPLNRGLEEGSLVWFPVDELPSKLPFWGLHRVHGGPAHWLSEEVKEAVATGQVRLWAALEHLRAFQAIQSAFEVARLECEVEGEGPDSRWIRIVTPRKTTYPEELHLRDVLAYAAHTAISPGEAGRMIAEGVVAELLGLDLRG